MHLSASISTGKAPMDATRLCCKNDPAMVSSALFKESRGVPFMKKQNPFKWRHFEAEIILLCVGWSLRSARSLPRPGRDDG